MEDGFKHLATTVMMAANEEQFNKRIRNYKAELQSLNKNCEIRLEINPNPESITDNFEETAFSISIYCKDDEF